MTQAWVRTAEGTGDRCPACRSEVVVIGLEDDAEVAVLCECRSDCALASGHRRGG